MTGMMSKGIVRQREGAGGRLQGRQTTILQVSNDSVVLWRQVLNAPEGYEAFKHLGEVAMAIFPPATIRVKSTASRQSKHFVNLLSNGN